MAWFLKVSPSGARYAGMDDTGGVRRIVVASPADRTEVEVGRGITPGWLADWFLLWASDDDGTPGVYWKLFDAESYAGRTEGFIALPYPVNRLQTEPVSGGWVAESRGDVLGYVHGAWLQPAAFTPSETVPLLLPGGALDWGRSSDTWIPPRVVVGAVDWVVEMPPSQEAVRLGLGDTRLVVHPEGDSKGYVLKVGDSNWPSGPHVIETDLGETFPIVWTGRGGRTELAIVDPSQPRTDTAIEIIPTPPATITYGPALPAGTLIDLRPLMSTACKLKAEGGDCDIQLQSVSHAADGLELRISKFASQSSVSHQFGFSNTRWPETGTWLYLPSIDPDYIHTVQEDGGVYADRTPPEQWADCHLRDTRWLKAQWKVGESFRTDGILRRMRRSLPDGTTWVAATGDEPWSIDMTLESAWADTRVPGLSPNPGVAFVVRYDPRRTKRADGTLAGSYERQFYFAVDGKVYPLGWEEWKTYTVAQGSGDYRLTGKYVRWTSHDPQQPALTPAPGPYPFHQQRLMLAPREETPMPSTYAPRWYDTVTYDQMVGPGLAALKAEWRRRQRERGEMETEPTADDLFAWFIDVMKFNPPNMLFFGPQWAGWKPGDPLRFPFESAPVQPGQEPIPTPPSADVTTWRGNFLAFPGYEFAFLYPGWPRVKQAAFRAAYKSAGLTHLPFAPWGAYSGQGAYDFRARVPEFRVLLTELLEDGLTPCVFMHTDRADGGASAWSRESLTAWARQFVPAVRDLIALWCTGWEYCQIDSGRAGYWTGDGAEHLAWARELRGLIGSEATLYAHFPPPRITGYPNYPDHSGPQDEARWWKEAAGVIDGLLYQCEFEKDERFVKGNLLGGPSSDGTTDIGDVNRLRPGGTWGVDVQVVFFEHSRSQNRWRRLVETVGRDARLKGFC